MATQARGLNGSRRLTNQIREQLLAVEVAVFLVKCSWSASQRSWESFSSITPSPKAPQRADLHGQITSLSSFNVQQYSYAEWGWWEGQMNISFSRFESPLGVVWARLELLGRFCAPLERATFGSSAIRRGRIRNQNNNNKSRFSEGFLFN